MIHIDDYLYKHKAEKIDIGISGADVNALDDKYILKHVVRNKLRNPDLFLSYKKEALFYQAADRKRLRCLPEVISTEETDEEILLLMKKYRMIRHSDVDRDVLARIMKAAAMVHHYEAPQFLQQDKPEVITLTDEQIKHCVEGWTSVLREHKGIFDEKLTEEIAGDINRIILWHAAGETNLIHGDFHLNNLLFDDDGEVVICDWQCVRIGHSSDDLGFFLSRYNSDGFDVSEQTVIDLYAEAVYDISGKRIDSSAVYCHMSAGTLITSFLYWHEYLHGNPEDRVGKVYREMGQIMSSIKRFCR